MPQKGFRQNSFKCGHAFVEENIYRNPNGKTACRTCQRSKTHAWAVAYRDTSLEIHRASLRKVRYKLDRDAWEAKFKSQDRCCAICKSKLHGGKDWSTDHDHACCSGKTTCGLCLRSILCRRCNTGLGCFLDTPELFRIAANYIEFWRKQHGRQSVGELVQRA